MTVNIDSFASERLEGEPETKDVLLTAEGAEIEMKTSARLE